MFPSTLMVRCSGVCILHLVCVFEWGGHTLAEGRCTESCSVDWLHEPHTPDYVLVLRGCYTATERIHVFSVLVCLLCLRVSFKQHRCSFPRGWDSLRRLQPAFVWAPCCRADLLLKAEMLAVCGLCIIDADCDWVPRAIGYNLKKSQGGVNSRWTRREVSRRAQRQWGSWRWLSGFGLKRRCLKRGGAERRPDSGDTTSLPVHFNEPGSQGET